MDIPRRLFGRDMLLGSTISATSDNKNGISGSKPEDPLHFVFTEEQNHVAMRLVSEEDSDLDAIFRLFKKECYNADSSAVVINATDLFLSDDKKLSPFDRFSYNTSDRKKRSETFRKSESFIEDVKAFEDNVSVKSSLSYKYTLPDKGVNYKDLPFTASVTRSILLLDSIPYMPRLVDSRIAIFPTEKRIYGKGFNGSKKIYYANRWRLEPSDIEAYKRGEKVTPLKPVVFYIDSAFPESWRPYIKEGAASVLDTDGSWKCIKDCGYTPIRQRVSGYYALGAGEQVDMNAKVSDWQDPENTLSGWSQAQPFALGAPHDDSSGTGIYSGHPLVASRLPQLERFEKRMSSVRRDGGLKIPEGWPVHKSVLTVPAWKTVDILLDQKELTNGYFNLVFSRGKAAEITVQYAESLYENPESGGGMRELVKGDRDKVEGKVILGRNDKLISSGGAAQEFSTLDWRTFRYVNLHIETKDEALSIDDVSSTFVGFPFELKASLDTSDPELHQMLEIGWRTARLCAIETYTDCPYYEQLQYLGDTRIQALVSLFNSGDDRLLRNYLHQADMSRNAEGITMGRAPSELPQYITPYALHYIYALHDYLMYGNDPDFVFDLVSGAEQIMKYFERYTLEDGRVSGLPGWNFTDWCYNPGWRLGVPQPADDGATSILDLQLLLAYQMLGHIEQIMGNEFMAGRYAEKEASLASAIQSSYWVGGEGALCQQYGQESVLPARPGSCHSGRTRVLRQIACI